jgi:HNH endonuclease
LKTKVRVTGPYVAPSGTTEGRRYVNVYWSDGSRGTQLYSRHLMEEHLGRPLDRNLETVDHKNGDKTDDSLENLQLLTRAANASKDAKTTEMIGCECPVCGRSFSTPARYVRRNQNTLNKEGPFCSRSCVGKWIRQKQIDAGQVNLRNPDNSNEHGSSGYKHRKCRCEICRSAHAEAARKYRAKHAELM